MTFIDTIKQFKDKNILVVGDSIIDVSVFGEAIGISLETPTLKALEKETEYSYGGAANVVENILELGAHCTFITLSGSDEYNNEVFNKFKHPNLTLVLINDKHRKNSIKKRYWVSTKGQNYKVLQLNSGSKEPITQQICGKIVTAFSHYIRNKDVVLFIDYRNGMLTNSLIKSLMDISRFNNVKTISSSQVSNNDANHNWYAGSDIICLNHEEANKNIDNFSISDLPDLSKKLNSSICLTSGRNGSAFYNKVNKKTILQVATKVEEVDPCGAGDCFLAILSICDLNEKIKESLVVCNVWAGLSIAHIGTKIPNKKDLISSLELYN